jgi:hypothetical protein
MNGHNVDDTTVSMQRYGVIIMSLTVLNTTESVGNNIHTHKKQQPMNARHTERCSTNILGYFFLFLEA